MFFLHLCPEQNKLLLPKNPFQMFSTVLCLKKVSHADPFPKMSQKSAFGNCFLKVTRNAHITEAKDLCFFICVRNETNDIAQRPFQKYL